MFRHQRLGKTAEKAWYADCTGSGIRKFPENKLELMEYYSFILFEKWLYMDSLDNISEANKIYYEIKAIADELSKDYADNQVTQMLSMGIVRKL